MKKSLDNLAIEWQNFLKLQEEKGEVFVLKVRETQVVYNHYAVKGLDKESAISIFKNKDFRRLCTKVTEPHYIQDVEEVEQVLTAKQFRELNNFKK
jgi:hypothetical protein